MLILIYRYYLKGFIMMDKYKLSIKNKKTLKLVNITLNISFIICSIGLILLYLFNTYCRFIFYKSGIIVFRTGILAGVFSIIYGIFFDNYLEYNYK